MWVYVGGLPYKSSYGDLWCKIGVGRRFMRYVAVSKLSPQNYNGKFA